MDNLYANVPRDLTRVKSKLFLNLTRRQILCFGAAIGVGLPLYFLLRKTGNSTMAAVRFGGGTVRTVSKENREYYEPPACYEPGTPNYAGVIGMGAAMDFWMGQEEQYGGRDSLYKHEKALLLRLEQELRGIPGMHILGDIPEGERSGCLSFAAEGVHAYDLCRFLDQYGIAARSGHHCAMPYLTVMGCKYAVRFSVAPYNTKEEILYAADACRAICELIRKMAGSCRCQ